MRQHGARDGLRGRHHAGDVYGQDAVACLSGVGQRRRFVLDPSCGDETVELGVCSGDAGDESVQRRDVENVDGVVG